MMDYPIRITTVCKCKRTIVVIATEYKVHNQDGSLHTCREVNTMADSEHLTYRDCPYYTCRSAGDWSQSVCSITGKLCDADEAGLECSIWEEEKAELLEEDADRQSLLSAVDDRELEIQELKEENEILKKHCSHLVDDCLELDLHLEGLQIRYDGLKRRYNDKIAQIIGLKQLHDTSSQSF